VKPLRPRTPSVVIALVVIAAGVAIGQTAVRSPATPARPALAPDRALTQLQTEAWGADEGLPQSRVEAVAQTRDGHLWFGTQEGLARFDGVTFTTVGRGPDALPDADVRSLAPAVDGGLWVGTRRGGLAHVDRDLRVRTFGTDAGLPSPAVAALAVEPDGAVWAGTFDGLCRLAPDADRFQCLGEADGLPTSYVRALLLGRDGTLWVGTRGGLARIAAGRVEGLAGLGGAAAEPTGALAEDGRGGLWIGPLSGHPLGYLRDGALRPRPEAAAADGLPTEALLLDDAGSLWIGTDGGGLFRVRGDRVETLAEADGADLGTVLSLFLDPEGSLWVGTGGGGLARLRTAKFTPITAREGLPADRAYAVAADPERGVWVGTTGGLAHVVGGRVVETLTSADGLPGDDVSAVYATRDGTVWAGVEGGGLCRVVGGRVAGCVTEGAGLPDPYVIALEEDADGTLWVGTATGVGRWTGRAVEPLDAPGAPEAAVTALGAADGALWIGTYGAGLHRFDGEAVEPIAGTEADNALSILPRPDGVWVGTDGSGLLHVVDGAVRRLTTAEGIPSQILAQVLDDGEGRIWLTSNRGVAAAPADALAEAARDGGAVRMTEYGRADGLPSAEANGGSQPAGARAADGTLYVPTNGGVAAIDPARIRTNAHAPPVAVERLRVDGDPVRLGDGPVTVGPGVSQFEIAYAGLSYVTPARVRHRYRLDGHDEDWTEAGARRQAFYNDLPPGDYVFRVQAANADGVWSETDATAAFTLRPHVWQTGWFAALCLLAGLGLAYAAYKGRTAQLRARAAHLEGVVAERTRELADEKARVESLNGKLSTFNARLQKYFPKKVAERILRQESDVRVEAERRPVTVVFTDLAGFTRLSEATPPGRVTALLNEYLNEMVALIDAHGGTLDKFMGDGIMVLFGAADPMPPDEQAQRAVAMAVEMQRAMGRLRASWEAGGLPHRVDLRIGIHQSEVTVGNFGSDELVEFTAIGRGVNLAARLESACAPGGVLVSEDVHALTADAVAFEPPRELSLKGIDAPVAGYPVALDAATTPA
jgi:class 3 adenylate cyclase/ligand-binding sensor domain-containing protein